MPGLPWSVTLVVTAPADIERTKKNTMRHQRAWAVKIETREDTAVLLKRCETNPPSAKKQKDFAEENQSHAFLQRKQVKIRFHTESKLLHFVHPL